LWYEGRIYGIVCSIFLEKKNYEKASLSPSNTKKYDVYFKRYVQTSVKETVRLYTSMKEFGLAKGV
jgi:hypothetical protein